LLLSVWVLTQVMPQAVYPPLQVMPQVPVVQIAAPLAGTVQACPQVPQLPALLERSTQAPLQFVSPDGQEIMHVPVWQTCPVGQTLPQAPQLLMSPCRSTHTPLQLVCPAGQLTTQPPLEHT